MLDKRIKRKDQMTLPSIHLELGKQIHEIMLACPTACGEVFHLFV